MLDYLDLEATLTETERMVRETARDFAADVREDVVDAYREGTFDEAWITEMGELGFYAPHLSGYGLADTTDRAYGLVMQELEACDSGLRSMASVQGALVIYPIHAFGTEDQRERYLPDLATGDLVGCFGLTEPNHGSNPSGMETTATPVDGGVHLDGTKTWITNATIADLALVWARSEGGDGPIRGYLVDTDREGLTATEIDDKLSMRASHTGELALNDVFVPAEHVLEVDGMKGPLSCLTQARYGIAWGATGAARNCFETARAYAQDREQFGGPIGRFQLQQEKLAEMATQITLGQLLADRLATLKAAGELRPEQVSMAKRNNVRMARETARTAREMLGGNGITLDYPPMRHMANMETVYTYEGTHDIHTLILGHDLTGIPAFE